MVKVEINSDEIKALDVLMDKAEVRPIVGFKVTSFRIRIQQALQEAEAQKKRAVERERKIKEAAKKKSKKAEE